MDPKGEADRKVCIGEMIRQTDCNRYVDMKRLAINTEE